jgi:hypothetical protein
MSRENVDFVRRFAEQYNETGKPPWAAMDPDVVWVIDPGAFLAGTYRGYDGVRTLFERLAEVFGELRIEIDRLIDAGDSVVAIGRFRVRGLLSGATGTQQIAAVLHLRDGLIVRYRSYLRYEEALEAVDPSQVPGRGVGVHAHVRR